MAKESPVRKKMREMQESQARVFRVMVGKPSQEDLDECSNAEICDAAVRKHVDCPVILELISRFTNVKERVKEHKDINALEVIKEEKLHLAFRAHIGVEDDTSNPMTELMVQQYLDENAHEPDLHEKLIFDLRASEGYTAEDVKEQNEQKNE